VEKGQIEVGARTGSLAEYYKGCCLQASYEVLRTTALTEYNKEQLG
jgi:hypothetical protein